MKSEDLNLMEELEQLYAHVPPAPKGLAEGRQRMLEAAALLKPAVSARPSTARLSWFRRLSSARAFHLLSVLLVVIFIVTATSGGVILASASSLPGDRLYAVKLGFEDIRLSLTADPTMQVERNLDFVSERVKEIRGLADQGDEIPDDVVTRMEAQMDQAVGYTMVAPKDTAPALVEELGLRMQRQQQVLVRIKAERPQKDEEAALDSALELAERVMLAVELAEGDPLRMQNAYQELASPVEPAGSQNRNDEQPGEPSATPEAEAPQSQPEDNTGAAGANSPKNEGESPSKPDSPGKRNNSDANSWDEPVGPAGASDLATSSSASRTGVSKAGAASPAKTAPAAVSVEAPRGK